MLLYLLSHFAAAAAAAAAEIDTSNATAFSNAGVGNAPYMGPFKVSRASDVFIGGMVSGPDQNAMVFYPSGGASDNKTAADFFKTHQASFPLVSFNHGIMLGGSGNQAEYSELVTVIASWGFVVVAMDGCATAACLVGLFAKDQLNVVERILSGKVDANKYPFFTLVSPDKKAGIAGHSYGGMATVINARSPGPNVGAAFALHPCPCFEGMPPQGCPSKFSISIPIFYTTGSLDTVCLPNFVKDDYDRTAGPKTAFANMKGITHFEPMNPPLGSPTKVWAPSIGNFFRCWLIEDQSACSLVYGMGSDSLCKRHDFLSCVTK